MASIGAQLKEARTKKSVTFEDVHSKIKIHPRVLQLLEEEKFDRLPSPLFVKSFLKSYAEFLEVNGDELVGLYEKEKTAEPEQVIFMRTADERNRQMRIRPRNFSVVAAVAAGIFLAGWLVLPPVTRTIGNGIKSGREALATYYKNAAAKKKGSTSSRSKPEKKGAPETAAAASVAKPEKDLTWLHSVEQGNFQAISKKDQLELEIRAIDTVWLKIMTDRKTAFQGLVKKGEKANVTANDQIEISTGNPDNMFWALNGRSIGSPGKGVARKMMVTREGIRNLQPARVE